MCKPVALSDGQMTLVDDIDYLDVVNRGTLYPVGKGYAQFAANKNQKAEYLHVFIGKRMGLQGNVDHRNLDRLDNRRQNLRAATQSQNIHNSRARCNNKSGAKGVAWDESRQKFQVHIKVNFKSIFLGRFETLEESKEAYRKASIHYFGQFSRTE